jgi:hypothetical protein
MSDGGYATFIGSAEGFGHLPQQWKSPDLWIFFSYQNLLA